MPETAELRALTAAIHEITQEVPALREQQHATSSGLAEVRSEQQGIRVWVQRLVMAIVFGIVVMGLIFSAFLWSVQRQSIDNQRAIETNNLRWCPLLLSIGPRPGAPAPAGNAEQQEYARKTRALISDISTQYGCKP